MPFQTRLNSNEHIRKCTLSIKTKNKRLKENLFKYLKFKQENMTIPNTLKKKKKAFPYLIQSQLANRGKGFNKEFYKYCSYKKQFLTQRPITGAEYKLKLVHSL